MRGSDVAGRYRARADVILFRDFLGRTSGELGEREAPFTRVIEGATRNSTGSVNERLGSLVNESRPARFRLVTEFLRETARTDRQGAQNMLNVLRNIESESGVPFVPPGFQL